MAVELQHFKPDELLLTQMEAWQVLVWFFGGNASALPGWLTDDDRAFAQALLVEAIDASADIGIIRRLWESTVMPPMTVRSLLTKIATTGAKILWDRLQHCSVEDFAKAKIYKMVKDRLTVNFRSVWQIRIDTGEPVLY
jgi:hypothetical protein